MRLFALFLPQFHEVKENNEWWGEGFTEWTHVNAAKPLYPSHYQPIAPANSNYYDLMEKSTVEWQTRLMRDHGIDGMVYYHYYFCGKKLLEKPAENLLRWMDIDQPFFFCWANHSWFKAVDGVKHLLIEQQYGAQPEWEEHFQYLLPFFRDARYEKKNNKPIFMIFNAAFDEKQDMMAYFDKRCKDEGFDGICVIETFSNSYDPNNYAVFRQNLSSQSEHVYVREPNSSQNFALYRRTTLLWRIFQKVLRTLRLKAWILRSNSYSGKKLYQIMMEPKYKEKDICHGVFFSWDNTPRHGVRGYVITPPSKEQFMRYADRIKNDEYVFINAWNEWAEGMILEPTEHDGYKYLEWIKEWKDKNRS